MYHFDGRVSFRALLGSTESLFISDFLLLNWLLLQRNRSCSNWNERNDRNWTIRPRVSHQLRRNRGLLVQLSIVAVQLGDKSEVSLVLGVGTLNIELLLLCAVHYVDILNYTADVTHLEAKR